MSGQAGPLSAWPIREVMARSGAMRAVAYSLAICAVSCALEALFAGDEVKKRLATMRLPPGSPPFWAWVMIGAFYYAICFMVSYRLFSRPPGFTRDIALALLGTLMFINALWNYFFFRSHNLFHAYLLGLLYGVGTVVLFILLLRLDRVAGWCLLSYILYLLYASIWSYRVWQLNPAGKSRDDT